MTKINRPWASTIHQNILYAKENTNGLLQVHKLARNYIASLDLGCPNANFVEEVDNHIKTTEMNGKEKYFEWVKNWKFFYAELSLLIRTYKRDKERRVYLASLKETAQVMLNARHNGKLASWAIVQRSLRLNQK